MAEAKDSFQQKCKLWTEQSTCMEAAINSTRYENKGLKGSRQTVQHTCRNAQETCKWKVEAGCRPGPRTVLIDEEEDKLATYLVQITDVGFGLNRDTVMEMAFTIVEKSQRKHPFRDGKAGCAWFNGF